MEVKLVLVEKWLKVATVVEAFLKETEKVKTSAVEEEVVLQEVGEEQQQEEGGSREQQARQTGSFPGASQ